MVVQPASKPGKTQSKAKPAVPLPVGIAVVVVLLLLVVWMGFHYFGPSTPLAAPKPLSADEQWIKQKAAESGGEISKLTPDDQLKLVHMKGDMAPSVLK